MRGLIFKYTIYFKQMSEFAENLCVRHGCENYYLVLNAD